MGHRPEVRGGSRAACKAGTPSRWCCWCSENHGAGGPVGAFAAGAPLGFGGGTKAPNGHVKLKRDGLLPPLNVASAVGKGENASEALAGDGGQDGTWGLSTAFPDSSLLPVPATALRVTAGPPHWEGGPQGGRTSWSCFPPPRTASDHSQ